MKEKVAKVFRKALSVARDIRRLAGVIITTIAAFIPYTVGYLIGSFIKLCDLFRAAVIEGYNDGSRIE